MIKRLINRICGLAGVRLINASWGPLGFATSLRRIQARGVEVRSIVDVGASTGVWTSECLRLLPNADYLLVDPLEENVRALAALAEENPRCRYWSGALGATEESRSIYTGGDQSSFFTGHLRDKRFVKREVPVRTLDAIVAEYKFPAPDLIKADVQGFELEVLKGASSCLETCSLLLLECSFQQLYENAPYASEVIAFAASKGFQIFDFCTYAQRPKDRLLAQSDILFAKQTSRQLFSTGWNC